MNNVKTYFNEIKKQIDFVKEKDILYVAEIFKKCKKNKKKIYICGNGGSSSNACHISNDLMLGLNKKKSGYPIISLSSNIAKITCLANDIGYENIYSHQILEIGQPGDVLVLLSGSGNSKNILKAIDAAKKKKIKTISVLGYSGGKAKKKSDYSIHFSISDMQVSEDMQLIFFNAVMKYLSISFK